jgi:serine/threonine protein kinase
MGSGISSQSSTNKQTNSADPEELKKRYRVNYVIGRGATSSVVNATDQIYDLPVALKRIHFTTKSSSSSSSASVSLDAAEVSLDELRTFKRIGSRPFIVSLHAAYRFKSSCYLAMDYLGGGDLRRYLRTQKKTMSEECVAYLIGCLGSALHHIHSRGVIHRDLKPENICFDLSGRPYLTDFGISTVSSEDDPIPICSSSSGTLAYLAPEVLTATSHHSHQSDFWSLGVVAHELLFGHRPFLKHCPLSLIQFSVNEYSSMWSELLCLPTASPLVDFDSIHRSSKKKSNRPLVFPHLNLHLNEDGSAPDALRVSFPLGAITLSDEFTSLLNGLLDVRIPQRLGNLNKFSEFSEHSLFLKHDYLSQELHHLPSPLCSSIEPLSPSPLSVLGSDDLDKDTDSPPLSTEMNLKLSEFHFVQSKSPAKDFFRKTERSMTSTGSNCDHTTTTAPPTPKPSVKYHRVQ